VPKDVIPHQEVMALLQMQNISAIDDGTLPLRLARARFERQYILHRLSANRGNLGITARDLGIERTNLYRKMKQLGIQASTAKSSS